jgi:surfeit locus 1 family protein
VNRRIGSFLALAVLLAAIFVGFGLWQLGRLGDRRARNAMLAAQLAQPEVPFERLPREASYRRAIVRGTPDIANEIVLTGRSRSGSPGVYLITPIRRAATDTAVLVVRGWVYSPDAATVDLARWREERREYSGYVAVLPAVSARREARRDARKVRALSLASLTPLLPYPIATTYLVATDSAPGTAPARLPMVALDDGRHLGYAIQWFAFAAIALIGGGAVALRARANRAAGATDA